MKTLMLGQILNFNVFLCLEPISLSSRSIQPPAITSQEAEIPSMCLGRTLHSPLKWIRSELESLSFKQQAPHQFSVLMPNSDPFTLIIFDFLSAVYSGSWWPIGSGRGIHEYQPVIFDVTPGTPHLGIKTKMKKNRNPKPHLRFVSLLSLSGTISQIR